MEHFKDFIIRLQTFHIKINQQKRVINGREQEIKFYDISEENPHLNQDLANEIRELRELAVTDILNLSKEQVHFHLQRLRDVGLLFRRFWERYYKIKYLRDDEQKLNFVLQLGLHELFIAPRLMYFDHATANDHFMNDLEDTVRYREQLLKDFESMVLRIIDSNPVPEKTALLAAETKAIKVVPVFRESIVEEFHLFIKDYFSPEDQQKLLDLLRSGDAVADPLLFTGNGNQLADAFRQLYDANLIVGCNKVELENWILMHFLYKEKGMSKKFSQKYLGEIISSNTKTCQAPLFDVRRSEGKLFLYDLAKKFKRF